MNYIAQVISPLHIGMGRTLEPAEHFVVADSQIRRIDFTQLFHCFTDGQLDDFNKTVTGQAGLAEAVKYADEHGIDISPAVFYTSPIFGQPRQITAFFSGGMDSNPLVPGTSVKGVIRSAITWAILRANPDLLAKAEQALVQQGRPKRSEFADDVLSFIWGPNPNQDFGRLFLIGDSAPISFGQVQMATVAVEVPRTGGQLKHKVLPRGDTTSINEATKLYVEVLRSGTTFSGAFGISAELFGEARLGWKPYQLAAIAGLPVACNTFVIQVIRNRKAFWGHYGVEVLAEKYDDLGREVLAAIEAGDGTFYLPMSWGTGLEAKTIQNLFSPAIQVALKQSYGQRFGDRVHASCSSFVGVDNADGRYWYCPKCRQGKLKTNIDVWAPAKSHKVVIDIDGNISDDLGWVKFQVQMPEMVLPSGVTPFAAITDPFEPAAVKPMKQAVTQLGAGKQTGQVKWFNDQKGYGFITPEAGSEDIFVHINDLASGYSINQGDQVEYTVGQSQRGPQAKQVRKR